VDDMRRDLRDLHAVMKTYKPTEQSDGEVVAHFMWMQRKPLYTVVYLVSTIANGTFGQLEIARTYGDRALDLLRRQLAAVDKAGGTVCSQYCELGCSDLYLPLLEQCVSVQLTCMDYQAAQQSLLHGVDLLRANGERYSDRRAAWHNLLALYFVATGERSGADHHIAAASALATREDDRLVVALATALRVMHTDESTDVLAGLETAWGEGGSADAAVVTQFLGGLQLVCSGDLDGARDMFAGLRDAKAMSKRLGCYVLVITSLCCDEASGDGAKLLGKAEKTAGNMHDAMFGRCLVRLGDSAKEWSSGEAHDAPLAAAAGSKAHQALLETVRISL